MEVNHGKIAMIPSTYIYLAGEQQINTMFGG